VQSMNQTNSSRDLKSVRHKLPNATTLLRLNAKS